MQFVFDQQQVLIKSYNLDLIVIEAANFSVLKGPFLGIRHSIPLFCVILRLPVCYGCL